MAKSNSYEAVPVTFTSPLARWPGSITLPDPNIWTRDMHEAWGDMLTRHEGARAMNRILCYAGLELIRQYGQWDMELPLDEVAGWESGPAKDEHVRLVFWIGKRIHDYMNSIVDPKS